MTPRNSLLRLFGISAPAAGGVARLEKSLGELERDVQAALQAFVAKNRPASRDRGERSEAPLELPTGLRSLTTSGDSELASFDPSATYVSLAPSGAASTIEVTPDFWATIDARSDLADGRLVAAHESNEDWPHWEMHPHGEEVLVLLSGRMTLVLETPDGQTRETRIDLLEGRAFVVPRGMWHRAVVEVPSKLLSITYGRGTEHRAAASALT
jgi:mannose-6-phosphate isomerase-like protein (cupin superfamily)